MKVSDILFEGPYLIDQDAKPNIKIDSYPSLEGLKRECNFLGTLEKDGSVFNFWINHSNQVAHVTTEAHDDIKQLRQLVVTTVRFHTKGPGLPVKKELQVDTVYTHSKFRNLWLAGSMYIVLARYGFSIVSDFSQYRGGKELWKKLARESEARKYIVNVWDDGQQDWVKTSTNQVLSYTANNLDDDRVWIDISQHSESTTLLVLRHG
jgi:hypothetical protein